LAPDAPLCTPHNLAALAAISDQMERDADNSRPAHKRLSGPKVRMPARKQVTLSRPTSSAELVPAVSPLSGVLTPTVSVARRSLPESMSQPALFTASVSRLNLPLEASVPWRSSRAPPWSPLNLRERALLEQSLQDRAELTLSMRLEAQRRSLVPNTLSLPPKWNSAQLGLYDEWPKGLLRPMGDGSANVNGLGLQGAFQGDGTPSRRVLQSFDLGKSLRASQTWPAVPV